MKIIRTIGKLNICLRENVKPRRSGRYCVVDTAGDVVKNANRLKPAVLFAKEVARNGSSVLQSAT
jgi:hypothetical protein